VIAVAQFMLILDLTVVSVALPDLGADLGLNSTALTWAVSAYGLVFGGLLLLGGPPASPPPLPSPGSPKPSPSSRSSPAAAALAFTLIPARQAT
jgi:MFS family permease